MSLILENGERKGVSTLSGSPREVKHKLDRIIAEQVVAVTFMQATEQEVNQVAQTISSIVQLVLTIRKQQVDNLDLLVDALVPKAMPTPTQLKEAAMIVRARTGVIESGDWMTAAEIAQLAGFSESNPSAQPNKWKREKVLFAIRHNGIDYFPSYGLDANAGYRPLKSMAKILETFGNSKDGWGLAYWFRSVNSFLDGMRPQDLLATDPARVIAAAQDELLEVA